MSNFISQEQIVIITIIETRKSLVLVLGVDSLFFFFLFFFIPYSLHHLFHLVTIRAFVFDTLAAEKRVL